MTSIRIMTSFVPSFTSPTTEKLSCASAGGKGTREGEGEGERRTKVSLSQTVQTLLAT